MYTPNDNLVIPAYETSRSRSRRNAQARKAYDRKPRKTCWEYNQELEAA